MPGKVQLITAVVVLILLVLGNAACVSSQPETAGEVDISATISARVEESQGEEAEPDIEATIEFSVAATQTALAPEQEPTEEPAPQSPEATETPETEGGSDSEPTAVPTPRTAVDSNPELLLPFWDDFDQGLDPVWRVINGRPLVVEGRLTSANDELSLELGNTSLKNYTIEIDIGGEDPNKCRGIATVTFGFSPTLYYSYWQNFGNIIGEWYAFESNDWEEISKSTQLDCGHMKIVVLDNRYTIAINGQLVEDLIFEPAEGPLLLRLDEGAYLDNFQISP